MIVVVVSTAFDPPRVAKENCLHSAQRQTVFGQHVYVDAAKQPTPLSHFENLLFCVSRLPDDAIVVSLDGDDWFAPATALERVMVEHEAGALVTYGSFVYADGRPGFARELSPYELANPRAAPWVTTHLKTFRAGLLRKIDPAHLKDANGKWLEHARDLALMFPLLEMVGERAHFIPDVLCVYNSANSTEVLHPETKMAELEAVKYVRGLPRSSRIA